MHRVAGAVYKPAREPRIDIPEKKQWKDPTMYHNVRNRAPYITIPQPMFWIQAFSTIVAPLMTLCAYDSCTIFMHDRKDTTWRLL